MLAAQYVGGRRIELAQVEATRPGPGQVQVAVAYTGICGTDLHILHGDMDGRVTTPAVLGHEMSGRVLECGPGVDDWRPGDAVTVMPLRWCGSCAACRAGHRHICQNLDFMGIDSPGSMQGIWTVPAPVLVRLPGTLRLSHGALVEPTAVAVHDVRRAQLSVGENVVVVGGGPVGVLVASVASARGARVAVVEPNGYRRSIAERIGFTVLDPVGGDVAELLRRWADEAGIAVSFEVSGTQSGLDLALQCLGPRGRMVQIGIHTEPRIVNLHAVFWRELTIVGARVYERADFEDAVALLAGGAIPADALISRIQLLESAAEAFDLLAGGEVMKVLVDCGVIR